MPIDRRFITTWPRRSHPEAKKKDLSAAVHAGMYVLRKPWPRRFSYSKHHQYYNSTYFHKRLVLSIRSKKKTQQWPPPPSTAENSFHPHRKSRFQTNPRKNRAKKQHPIFSGEENRQRKSARRKTCYQRVGLIGTHSVT